MSEHEFELYLRLLGKFLRLTSKQQAEIADELRDHLEARLEELSRAGMAHEEAIRLALDELGDAAGLADHFTQIVRQRKRRLIMRCSLSTVAAAAAALIIGSTMWPADDRAPAVAGLQSAAAEDKTAKVEQERLTEAKPAAIGGFAAQESERDRAVRGMLESTTLECAFAETPMIDVLQFIGEQLSVDVYAPRSEFAAEIDMPITLELKHAKPSARTVLDLALRQVQLTYTVRDGIVMICRPDTALEIRVYDCAPLNVPTVERRIDMGGLGGASDPTASNPNAPVTYAPPPTETLSGAAALAELITDVVRPDVWTDVGGPSQIRTLDTRLVVRAAPETHRDIESLLEQLAAPKPGVK